MSTLSQGDSAMRWKGNGGWRRRSRNPPEQLFLDESNDDSDDDLRLNKNNDEKLEPEENRE